jgi:hypothetical protein
LDAKLIFLIYTALQWAASPFILVYFVLRFLRDARYLRHFSERLGFLPPAASAGLATGLAYINRCILCHA